MITSVYWTLKEVIVENDIGIFIVREIFKMEFQKKYVNKAVLDT